MHSCFDKKGYEIENKIFRVCTGLNINEENLKKNINNLSGGEKTRVLLAKAILREPEVLLLDEPTNHIDLTSIEWLEGYIKEYKGTVLFRLNRNSKNLKKQRKSTIKSLTQKLIIIS